MAGRERLEFADDLDARERGVQVLLLDPAFLDEFGERLRDRFLGGLGRAGLGVINEDADAALREHLDDAAAHRAAAGDTGEEILACYVEHGHDSVMLISKREPRF